MNPASLAARLLILGTVCAVLLAAGCRSPASHRKKADRDALSLIERHQLEHFGETRPLQIETPADTLRRRLIAGQVLPYAGAASLGRDQLEAPRGWPETEEEAVEIEPHEGPLTLSLLEALEIAAGQSRDYQSRKEDIFRAALRLDVEGARFRNQYEAGLESNYITDRSGEEQQRGIVNAATLGVTRTLRTGADVSGRLAFDLVKLLTLDKPSAYGLLADLSVSIPLLQGAGRHLAAEPLTQAEREVMYAMFDFEQFRQRYAVRVASDYLEVLQQLDQVRNASNNFERIRLSTQRARRLADAGRLPEIQVDQAQQEEWRARERWLSAQVGYERRLDSFKVALGLPADAGITLDETDLIDLLPPIPDKDGFSEPYNLEASTAHHPLYADAITVALALRRDVLIAQGRVYDAQRQVVVAADGVRLRAALTGTARAGSRRSLGTAGDGDARLRPDEGLYGVGLSVDMPWNRSSERAAYRDSYIVLERAIRTTQELEDTVKQEVRQTLRVLDQAAESIEIQARSVALAERRVESTELFLQAGRAQIRDVLEAQESLISAQNALTAAAVTYRLAQLELQRDMGTLTLDNAGRWLE